FRTAHDALHKLERRTAEFFQLHLYLKLVINTRLGNITHVGTLHHEQEILVRQGVMLVAEGAQPFGTGALHELELVDVIDDATGIRVLDIDTHRQGKYGLAHESNRSPTELPDAGGLKPKCRQA